MSSIDLKWMVGRSIGQVTLTDPDYWLFQFATGGVLSAECHWRILDHGHIALSNDDHQQQFGLPEPIDAAEVASRLLSSLAVTNVEVREGTADLLISFTQDKQLQLIPFSSGYESWQVEDPFGSCIVAQGGGQLSSWKA
jgi:hypothetical protein